MRLRSFVLACALAASCAPLRAADLPTAARWRSAEAQGVPSITMQGEAEETVKPDYALLTLEASDAKPTPMAAAVENSRLTQALVARLQKYGLSGADVEADDLVVTPEYREHKIPHSEDVEKILTGYRASTVYRVKIHDLDAAPKIAREIVEGGANVYSGLSFEIRDGQERLASLRDKALQDAVANAQHFAKIASVQLGDILRIEPSRDSISGGGRRFAGAPSDEVAFSVPARVSDVRVRAAVTVTWELKPLTPPPAAATPSKSP